MLRSWTWVCAPRIAALLAVGLTVLAHGSPCFAKETLYATSLRSQIGGGAFIAGNLYVVDPATAASTLIGAIHVDGTPVGVAAIATHPGSGVVYGISAGLSPTIPRSLLQIDIEKATATIVARLAVRGSDIGFAPDGSLYMWAPDLHQLVKIELETGAATPVGRTPIEGTAGGAVAISADGRDALVAVNGANGKLLRIDIATGQVTDGPQMSGAPYDASLDNLTLSPAGVLYGVNSDGGAPSRAALVIVDPVSGAVSKVGTLPDDVRGLIFAAERMTTISREMIRKWVLVALGLVAAGIILYASMSRGDR